jgi:hypothetical protein
MASDKEMQDLLRALDGVPKVSELEAALDSASKPDDLLRALGAARPKCNEHLAEYLRRLEALAVGILEMKRLGERASGILAEVVNATREQADQARGRMDGCPECSQQYRVLYAAMEAQRRK